MPIYCLPIPLEKTRPSLYIGQIPDDRQFQPDVEFYLGIKAQMPESELIEAVQRGIKIASPRIIEIFVGRHLPDIELTLKLTLTDKLLGGLSPREGFKYFKLDTSGPFWEAIKNSKTLAIYLTDDFVNERLELYAARDNNFRPPIFRDCYEAVENLLSLALGDDRWWSCVRREGEPLYRWDDDKRRGNAIFKIKVGKEEKGVSNLDRLFVAMGENSGLSESRYLVTELDLFFRRYEINPELYLIVDLKRGLIRLFFLNLELSSKIYEAFEVEVEISPIWLENLRNYPFPGERLEATNIL